MDGYTQESGSEQSCQILRMDMYLLRYDEIEKSIYESSVRLFRPKVVSLGYINGDSLFHKILKYPNAGSEKVSTVFTPVSVFLPHSSSHFPFSKLYMLCKTKLTIRRSLIHGTTSLGIFSIMLLSFGIPRSRP